MASTGTVIISLSSAVIVALISYFLSGRQNRRNELAEFRLKAYTDFINAVSRLATLRRLGKTSDELEELAVLNDAKARICICADIPVVKALSDFWESGSTLEGEREILAFNRLCLRIRESLGNKRHDFHTLSDTLFKLEPSAFSYRTATNPNKQESQNKANLV